MALREIVLTDTAGGIRHDDYRLRAADGLQLAGSNEWKVEKRTLRGGLSDGVDVVELNNGRLAVSILPTRGMGLWRGEYQCDDGTTLPVGWESPVERPVHPRHVELSAMNGLGWLAGFNELLCRCGLVWNGPPGDDGGTPLTLHGRIANIPAHRVEVRVDPDGEGRIAVSGTVDEAYLFGPRLRLTSTVETTAGSNRLRVIDEVRNLAGRPAEMQLLYHVNLGRPFLEEGGRVVVAARDVQPRDERAAEGLDRWQVYGPPEASFAEQAYFIEPHSDPAGDAFMLLRDAAGRRGFSVRFNTRSLPCLTVWKCTQAEADGYVTGLEPATNFPNFKSVERRAGRLVNLAPGESWRSEIELAVHAGSEEVAQAEGRATAG